MGHGPGGQRSSAFAQTLGGAGAGLESQLASQGAQFGLQARGQQMDWLRALMNMGLQQQYETQYMPGTKGFLPGLWEQGQQSANELIKILPYLM